MKQKETISEGKAMNRARRWRAEHGRAILRDLPDFAARRIRSDGGEKPPLARGLENAALFPLVLAALTL